ncbi:MAG: hypothetical protein Q7R54_01375 [bacterium]|nr:hypothetical protein [bacterium]
MGDIGLVAGILAGVLSFAEYPPYILAILGCDIFCRRIQQENDYTKPSRATWFILSFVNVLILASWLDSGVHNPIWYVGGQALGCFVTGVLTFKYGARWTLWDGVCLFGAFITILLWVYYASAEVALYASIVVDFLALTPTIIKSWDHPEWENRLSWDIALLASTINLLAVERWDLISAYLYPVYIAALNGIIVWVLRRKRKTVSTP